MYVRMFKLVPAVVYKSIRRYPNEDTFTLSQGCSEERCTHPSRKFGNDNVMVSWQNVDVRGSRGSTILSIATPGMCYASIKMIA